jgi:hypothetical protein
MGPPQTLGLVHTKGTSDVRRLKPEASQFRGFSDLRLFRPKAM